MARNPSRKIVKTTQKAGGLGFLAEFPGRAGDDNSRSKRIGFAGKGSIYISRKCANHRPKHRTFCKSPCCRWVFGLNFLKIALQRVKPSFIHHWGAKHGPQVGPHTQTPKTAVQAYYL